jgi:hypothetical protein
MFILYAVVVGLLVGFLSGGRVAGLAAVRVRWAPLIVAGLVAQVILFSEAVAPRVGDLGPALYVGSTLLVLAAVVRNHEIPGLMAVIVGAACNVAAVVANGGYMPAAQAALEAAGRTVPAAYSNSSAATDVALWPLTDVFALPSGLPLANVFSVGDVLIGLGIGVAILVAMRRRVADAGVAQEPSPSGGAAAQ